MAKSTVYLDDTQHVRELSLPVAGGQWTGANANSATDHSTDETVTVHWWYNTGRACRYRIGYLVEGVNCVL